MSAEILGARQARARWCAAPRGGFPGSACAGQIAAPVHAAENALEALVGRQLITRVVFDDSVGSPSRRALALGPLRRLAQLHESERLKVMKLMNANSIERLRMLRLEALGPGRGRPPE